MLRRLAILLVSISTILVAAQASAKPSRSSVRASLNKKHTDSTERGERVARQRQPDSWELGLSWGQGVLRTLERGAESNDGLQPSVFHHENHPSVWGLHIGRMFGLTGHWSLGWELGYKDLGKTSGFFDRFTNPAGQRFSDRLLRAEGFDGLLRIDYALDRHWGVYGSLGAMVWQIHRTVVGNNVLALDGDASRTQMDPEYALGLRYAYGHVLLSLSYDRVMGSESGTQDNMAGQTSGTPTLYLSPTSSSVLLGLSVKLKGSGTSRLSSDYDGTGWELGFSWGQGVLRTLERGAENNDAGASPAVFHHENHPSVWGLHIGRLFGLTGHWSLGWELGYKDLGKTSGFFDNRGTLAAGSQRFSDRLLRAEGFDGLLRIDYALDRHWGVYGSLGAMVWQIHRTVVGNNGFALDGDASRTQMDPEYALGLRYAYGHVLLSLSYDRVMGSESGTQDNLAGQFNGTPTDYVSPTSSSVLLGLSVKLKGSGASRLSSDYDGTGWELGFSWGQGVLRTLERGAESSDGLNNNFVFHHVNYPSVWGLHIGRLFGLTGHWSLGWELGYKDLGKTSGFYDRRNQVAGRRFSDRLLRAEGFDGLLRLDYALDRHWGVYGSLGAMVWQIHRTVVGNNLVALDGDASRTQMDPEYALGLRYAFRHVLLSLSYDRVMGSESGTHDNMTGQVIDTPTLYLSPTSSSVLLGLSVKLQGSRATRLSSDYDGTGWEIGFSWGEGVLRTLERGAESNDAGVTPAVFHHENHPSVWGLHLGRMFGLTGHWSLGWELGYKDLGKTSGFYDDRHAAANQRFSDRLLRAEGFDGLLRLDYALDRHWGVYGSLGAMVWQIHRTVVGNNGGGGVVGALDGDASRTQMDPEYALGLRYAYRHVLVSLSYDRVMGSESGTQDNLAGDVRGTSTHYLSPTSSSVLLGLSVKLKGSGASRLSSDYDGTGWEIGLSWGQGVLHTLERGAESNESGTTPVVFHHENHPSVWGLHIGRMYGLTGHWSLGWELGYKELGKTSGFVDNRNNAAGLRFSDRLLRAEGFDGLLRLDYALDRHWGVYGSLGAMVWQIHRTVVGNNGGGGVGALDGDASRTQMDPEYALGLRYAFRHVLLSLSYDRVMGSESGTQDNLAGQILGTPTLSLSPTSSSVLLGLSIHFNL